MNAGFVTVLIGLGAGAIALWIDVRFPRLAPQELVKAVLHVAASVAVGYATSPAMQMLVAYDDPRLTLLAVFGLAFPAIVYCLLAGIWVIKLVQRTLSGHLR
jgi:ABC-type uncharacterized transport system permease subunit